MDGRGGEAGAPSRQVSVVAAPSYCGRLLDANPGYRVSYWSLTPRPLTIKNVLKGPSGAGAPTSDGRAENRTF
ncbi:MAG: hypothetical protein BJ554DRAFT_176 [Olpidium bornovanus]|uniref:Uncharacterized protein n=1 Tax=Olpidium bornovanus TaxID=278681 RepID=A0A8H7ZUR8_9FUNG|nr:MAG: hypothetical protein BJ554DRAFT_176 [Olpidium bornovanus]